MCGLSLHLKNKCRLDPDLGCKRRSLPQKTREQFSKGLQALNNLCSDSFSLLIGSFYFQTKRTNRSTGVFLESPGIRVGRSFNCCWFDIPTPNSILGSPSTMVPSVSAVQSPFFHYSTRDGWCYLWDTTPLLMRLRELVGCVQFLALTLCHAFFFPLKVNQ